MLVLQVDPSKVTENCLSNSNFAVVSLYHSDFQTLRFISEAENMPYTNAGNKRKGLRLSEKVQNNTFFYVSLKIIKEPNYPLFKQFTVCNNMHKNCNSSKNTEFKPQVWIYHTE